MSTIPSGPASTSAAAARAGRGAAPPDTSLLRIEWPTADQFRQLLDSFSPEVLTRRYLLGGVPHLFKDDPVKYITLRETVAKALGVGHHDVGVVGSARLGLTLSGQKGFGHFAMGHDIDIAIVSEALVNDGLDAFARRVADLPLRGAKDEDPIDPADLRDIQRTARNYAAGYLSPDTFPEDDPFRQRVSGALAQVMTVLLAVTPAGPVSRPRGRVFRSWADVEATYAGVLRNLSRRGRGEDGDGEE